jgi:hypothetical protein
MLQVGRLGCPSSTSGCPPATPQLLTWTRAHYAAFAIVSSPLVLSIHPSDKNLEPILDIIGNKQAMAVNQAWAGHPGTLVRTLPNYVPPPPPVEAGSSAMGVPCDPTDATEKWAYDSEKTVITHGGKCLTTTGMNSQMFLTTCGNTTDPLNNQKFTYDATTMLFKGMAPAPKKLYPGCLSLALTNKAGNPVKVCIYGCGKPNQKFAIDAKTGAISTKAGTAPLANWCLAARKEGPPVPASVAGVQIWAKPLGNGKTAALFINGGGSNYTASMSLKELNVTATNAAMAASVKVTDVWSGADAGAVVNGNWSTGVVGPLDSKFVIFETPAGY